MRCAISNRFVSSSVVIRRLVVDPRVARPSRFSAILTTLRFAASSNSGGATNPVDTTPTAAGLGGVAGGAAPPRMTLDDLGKPPSQRARQIAELEAVRSMVEAAKQKSNGSLETPEVLDALNQLAHVYHRAGDTAHEIETLDLILPAAEKTFGATHPNSLMVKARRLSAARFDQPEKAKEGLLELQPLFVQVFGSDHEVTMTLGHTIASTYHALEEYEAEKEILIKQLEILRRTMGETMEPTRATVLCLSRVLGYLDDAAANRELLQGHLEVARTELGEDHPHVLQTACGLALSLAVEEKYAEELALRQSLVASMLKRFGPDDVNVVMNDVHLLIAQLYAARPAEGSATPAAAAPNAQQRSDSSAKGDAASAMTTKAATVASPRDPAVDALVDRVQRSVKRLEATIGANHSDTLNVLLRFADALASFPGREDQGAEVFKIVESRAQQRAGPTAGTKA